MVTGLWELKKTINSKHKSWKSQLRVESESESEVLSHIRLFATPWTVAHQAPPTLTFKPDDIKKQET